jgi:NADH-quinone oxidoreductase subunit N
MSGIVAYLITAVTILIVHNVINKGEHSRELGIVTLVMVLGMTTSVIEQIIVVSGLITIIISRIDEETTTLFILGIIGLIVITGTKSLILLYIGLEIIGLTFYVLASRERKGIKSTEAGIKYFILGALSSGILLLGMSLAYATTGTTSLELVSGASATMIKIGLLFKLGATPFHM